MTTRRARRERRALRLHTLHTLPAPGETDEPSVTDQAAVLTTDTNRVTRLTRVPAAWVEAMTASPAAITKALTTTPVTASASRAARTPLSAGWRPVPSCLRDALTGAPLSRDVPYWMRYHGEVDRARPSAHREPIPLVTHRNLTEDSAPEPGYAAAYATSVGSKNRRNAPQGCVFSSPMQRYLRGVLPKSVAEERAQWLSWWDVAYVVERLTARFGAEAMGAVLAVVRDDEALAAVAARYQHSEAWLCRRIRLVRQQAPRYFRPRAATATRTTRPDNRRGERPAGRQGELEAARAR